MVTRIASLATATLIAVAAASPLQAQELSAQIEAALTACADQIDSAYTALHGVCTAAAVVDLAATPDSPNCGIARAVIVEYVKACVEHASALLREGEPLELPPFPDLGPGIIATAGGIGPAPAPRWWPWPFVFQFAQLPVAIAAMKHEALLGSLQGALGGATVGGGGPSPQGELGGGGLIATPTDDGTDTRIQPVGAATGATPHPSGGQQADPETSTQPDVVIGPTGGAVSGEVVPRAAPGND